MPYVVKYGGKYLFRSANATGRTSRGSSSRRRRWTPNINEASTWSEPGHAKNAAREAWIAKMLSATAIVEIVQVDYREGVVAARMRRIKTRYGGMKCQDVVR